MCDCYFTFTCAKEYEHIICKNNCKFNGVTDDFDGRDVNADEATLYYNSFSQESHNSHIKIHTYILAYQAEERKKMIQREVLTKELRP